MRCPPSRHTTHDGKLQRCKRTDVHVEGGAGGGNAPELAWIDKLLDESEALKELGLRDGRARWVLRA